MHRLILNRRIIYKIMLLAYKYLHGTGPAYLKNYCITLLAYKYLYGTGPAYLKNYCITFITQDLNHYLRSVAHADFAHPATRTRRLALAALVLPA